MCEEAVNCWKCGDDKSIDQKQKTYYYIGQQEDGCATVKKIRKIETKKINYLLARKSTKKSTSYKKKYKQNQSNKIKLFTS